MHASEQPSRATLDNQILQPPLGPCVRVDGQGLFEYLNDGGTFGVCSEGICDLKVGDAHCEGSVLVSCDPGYSKLRLRLDCYRATSDPRFVAATRDLSDFLSREPAPLAGR